MNKTIGMHTNIKLTMVCLFLIAFFLIRCSNQSKVENVTKANSDNHRTAKSDYKIDTIKIENFKKLVATYEYFEANFRDIRFSNKGIVPRLKMVLPKLMMEKYGIQKQKIYSLPYSIKYDSLSEYASMLIEKHIPFIIEGVPIGVEENENIIFFSKPFDKWVYAELRNMEQNEIGNTSYSGNAIAFLFEFNEFLEISLIVQSNIHYF